MLAPLLASALTLSFQTIDAEPSLSLQLATAQPATVWSHDNPAQTCGGSIRFWDGPFRAFRDSTGEIHVPIPHGNPGAAFELTGPNVLALVPDCAPILVDTDSPVYSDYAAKEWLTSVYTNDGETVHGIVHSEFHMHAVDPQICSSSEGDCRNTALTYVRSVDGGESWDTVDEGQHWIAVDPNGYDYADSLGFTLKGFQEPSNVVFNPNDGYYYFVALMNVRREMLIDGSESEGIWGGPTAFRTRTPGDPSSWLGYGGAPTSDPACLDHGFGGTGSFDVKMEDPCLSTDVDTDPFCAASTLAPLDSTPGLLARTCETGIGWLHAASRLGQMHEGLVFVPSADAFVLVGMHVDHVDGEPRPGIFYSVSTDLTDWSEPSVLLDLTGPTQDGRTFRYPALFDPTSSSMSFDTLEDAPFLVFEEKFPGGDGTGVPKSELLAIPLLLDL